MSKSRVGRTYVNGEFIRETLKEKNLDGVKASFMIGRGHDNVNKMIRENEGNLSDVLALCCALEINKDDVITKPAEEEITEITSNDNSDILSELQKLNKTMDDIANCFAVMTKLYERAWIDKE